MIIEWESELSKLNRKIHTIFCRNPLIISQDE
jgi:hypothetical protein